MLKISKILLLLVLSIASCSSAMETKISLAIETRGSLIDVLKNQAKYEFEQGNLHVFDGISGNNQCHINALIISNLYNKWKATSDNNLITNNQEFLAYNLLLSSSWLLNTEKSLLVERIRNTRVSSGNSKILPKRSCTRILTTKGSEFSLREMVESTKRDLNQIITSLISNLSKDFCDLDNDINLNLTNLLNSDSKARFAKISSIMLFLEINKKWKVHIVLNIKHICNHKTIIKQFLFKDKSLIEYDANLIPEDTAIIVIDAIASSSHEITNFNEFKNLRDKCPSNFFYEMTRKESLSKDIKLVHKCANCDISENRGNSEDCNCISVWQTELLKEDFNSIMLSIAASFTIELQSELIKDISQWSLINNNLEQYNEYAKSHSMHSKDIRKLFIEHVYPITKAKFNIKLLKNNKRLVDIKPEEMSQLLK